MVEYRVEGVERPIVVLPGLQRRVVVGKVVPGAVKVVGHHVEEVQRLGNPKDIETLVVKNISPTDLWTL